jgi:hypothetical protein
VTWTKAASYGGTYGIDFWIETSATLAPPWTQETEGGNVTITGDEVKFTFPAGTKTSPASKSPVRDPVTYSRLRVEFSE